MIRDVPLFSSLFQHYDGAVKKIHSFALYRCSSVCKLYHVGVPSLALLLLLPGLLAQNLPTKSQYIFRVPAVPGTELFESNPDLTSLTPPIGTVVEVFQTKDGRSLDKESVIAFYRAALEAKGWKEGIFKRRGDRPYLSMRTNVFETLPDHTRIQLAGEFYLWVAPLDGMLTIYQKQWRISSVDQVTLNALQEMIKRMTDAAVKAGYRAMRIFYDSGWRDDYENEYLVDRVSYCLVPNDAPRSIDAPPESLTVSLLTYRDTDIAAGEKAAREQEFRSRRGPHFAASEATKGKILVTITGDAARGKLESVLTTLTLP
jgi:hypothetical protein